MNDDDEFFTDCGFEPIDCPFAEIYESLGLMVRRGPTYEHLSNMHTPRWRILRNPDYSVVRYDIYRYYIKEGRYVLFNGRIHSLARAIGICNSVSTNENRKLIMAHRRNKEEH